MSPESVGGVGFKAALILDYRLLMKYLSGVSRCPACCSIIGSSTFLFRSVLVVAVAELGTNVEDINNCELTPSSSLLT